MLLVPPGFVTSHRPVRFVAIVLTLGLSLSTEVWAQGPKPGTPEEFDDSEFEGPEDEFEGPEDEDAASPVEAYDAPEAFPEEPAPPLEPMVAPARGSLRPGVSDSSAGSQKADATRVLELSKPELITEAAVWRTLDRRARATAVADQEGARLATQELLEIKRNLGIRNVVLAAALLLREAQVELRAERLDDALERAMFAVELAPDLPAAHWMRARALWAQDPSQVVQIGAAVGSGLGATFGVFRNAVTVWGWLIAAALCASGMLTAGWTLVQLFKYLRYAASDVAERFPGVLGTGEFTLVLWILVTLPFALGFGLATSVALGLWLPFAYQSWKERLVTVGLALGLALTPGILWVASPLVLFHGSNADVLAMALTEVLSVEARERFQDASEEDSDLWIRVRAYRARQRGELKEALDLYQRALQAQPTDPVLLNNLAVLHVQNGEEEAALPLLRKAISSQLAEPRLNLSLMLADDGEFERADRLLDEARALNPALTEAFTDSDGAAAGSRLLDVPLGDSVLWRQLASPSARERSALVAQLWRPVGGALPALWFPLWVLVCALAAVATLSRRMGLSVGCTRCGRPAQRGEDKPLCSQCYTVFITAAAVDPKARQDKEAEVRSYQRRRRWLERGLSPLGLGLVLGNRPLLGAFLAAVLALCAASILTRDVLSMSAWTLWMEDGPDEATFVLFSALAMVTSAVAVFKTIER